IQQLQPDLTEITVAASRSVITALPRHPPQQEGLLVARRTTPTLLTSTSTTTQGNLVQLMLGQFNGPGLARTETSRSHQGWWTLALCPCIVREPWIRTSRSLTRATSRYRSTLPPSRFRART